MYETMKNSLYCCMNIKANEPYLANSKARGGLQLIMATTDNPKWKAIPQRLNVIGPYLLPYDYLCHILGDAENELELVTIIFLYAKINNWCFAFGVLTVIQLTWLSFRAPGSVHLYHNTPTTCWCHSQLRANNTYLMHDYLSHQKNLPLQI